MTDTIRLLNLYRIPLLHEARAFELFALVVKHGRSPDSTLSIESGGSVPEVRRILTDLFRANLLRLRNDSYELSHLGSVVASSFGLWQTAFDILLRSSSLPEGDRDVLMHCYNSQSSDHERGSEGLAMLRSWLRAYPQTPQSILEDSLWARVVFAIIIGLDPSLHRLGPEKYTEDIAKHFKPPEGSLRNYSWDLLRKTCANAHADVKASDDLLWFTMDAQSNARIGSEVTTPSVIALTMVRMLTALTERRRDIIVHGDLKPSNILLNTLWKASLTSFLPLNELLGHAASEYSAALHNQPEANSDRVWNALEALLEETNSPDDSTGEGLPRRRRSLP